MYPTFALSSLGVKLRVMLLGESIILPVGNGGGGAYESEYEVPLVPENDLVVDGREDEKLLFRSLRNMAVLCPLRCGRVKCNNVSVRMIPSLVRSVLQVRRGKRRYGLYASYIADMMRCKITQI